MFENSSIAFEILCVATHDSIWLMHKFVSGESRIRSLSWHPKETLAIIDVAPLMTYQRSINEQRRRSPERQGSFSQ